MTQEPEVLLREGDLSASLAALQDRVRANPSDSRLRIFLFQLLCVLGDWKRAITQLKLCAELDASALPMAQTYREAIICEVFRAQVFAGEKSPLILGAPADWVAELIEALRLAGSGALDEAETLRARAFDAAPASAGDADGMSFEWIADADMRLGPVLEIIVDGKYYWLPFDQIEALEIEAPSDLRDAVWMAAQLTLRGGGQTVALIPTRYAGTGEGSDAERLARGTRWQEDGAGRFVGIGQRILATSEGDVALMDLRKLTMQGAPDG